MRKPTNSREVRNAAARSGSLPGQLVVNASPMISNWRSTAEREERRSPRYRGPVEVRAEPEDERPQRRRASHEVRHVDHAA